MDELVVNTSFYTIICLLLVTVGFIAGGLFQADLTTSSRLSKLLSSCASVATIVGIIFAAQNLLLWRRQFTYKKLDEVLEEIEESIHELVAAYHKTWTAKFNYLIKTSGDVTPEE